MTDFQPFIPSKNKIYIRENYDKDLVKELSTQINRKLCYLGLTGPYMHDILTWQDNLDTCVAVEYDEKAKDLLLEAAFLNGLSSKLEVIQEDIDHFIINNIQKTQNKFFDIVNLDYYGAPLILNKEGESFRYRAIESLFEYQLKFNNQAPFVLFITAGVRNKDKGQIDLMLDDVKRHVDENLIPLNGTSEYTKMKIIVPYIVRAAAAPRKWDVTLKYGITYKGSNNIRMVHFAFWSRPSNTMVVDHHQTMSEVCKLPLISIDI